jgi:hypothetical protein
MARNGNIEAVLAGALALHRHSALLPHAELMGACQPLLERLDQPDPQASGWARTPWGWTLPRSCVGTTAEHYRASLDSRPREACLAVDQLLLPALSRWLHSLFERPLQPLQSADGLPLPWWALRVMGPGGGIDPHCEQVWNPHNLIENNSLGLQHNSLGPVALDPAFQLSFLYILQAPSSGGELELFQHRGGTPPVAAQPLQSVGLVPPRPGEALLFNAGEHWHRVRPCQGPQPRLVLGGFLRLDRDRRRLLAYV